MIKFEDYVNRFAELCVELNDEQAAIMVLSIEQDPIACVSMVSDLMHGQVDNTANKLYSAFALSETGYVSVQKAVDHLISLYRDKKLPENIPYAMSMDNLKNLDEGYDS